MTKVCKTCQVEKDLSQFYFYSKKSQYMSYCRSCDTVRKMEWASKFQDKEKRYETQKKWVSRNREKLRVNYKKYHNNNKEKRKVERVARLKRNLLNPEFKAKFLEKRRARYQRRMKEPTFKLSRILRSRLQGAHVKKRGASLTMLGCSLQEFRAHLESQFHSGMSWENYGMYGWHVDHIYPIAVCKTDEQLAKCFHYTNCRPLWYKENLIKSWKVPEGATL